MKVIGHELLRVLLPQGDLWGGGGSGGGGGMLPLNFFLLK